MRLKAIQKIEGTLDLYFYDAIQPGWYDWFGNRHDDETSAEFIREKLAENSGVSQINMYINSEGGSVKEGYGIYAMLKRHPAKKTAYIDGFAYSIASIIALGADEIVMYPHSAMGIHNMMDYCFGNAEEHRAIADDLDKLMEGNRQIYLQRSNGKLSEDDLRAMLDKETILSAEECLEYGFCDRLEITVPEREDEGLNQYKAALTAYRGAVARMKKPDPAQDPKTPKEKTLSEFFNTLTV